MSVIARERAGGGITQRRAGKQVRGRRDRNAMEMGKLALPPESIRRVKQMRIVPVGIVGRRTGKNRNGDCNGGNVSIKTKFNNALRQILNSYLG